MAADDSFEAIVDRVRHLFPPTGRYDLRVPHRIMATISAFGVAFLAVAGGASFKSSPFIFLLYVVLYATSFVAIATPVRNVYMTGCLAVVFSILFLVYFSADVSEGLQRWLMVLQALLLMASLASSCYAQPHSRLSAAQQEKLQRAREDGLIDDPPAAGCLSYSATEYVDLESGTPIRDLGSYLDRRYPQMPPKPTAAVPAPADSASKQR